jgi:hypothetical protein
MMKMDTMLKVRLPWNEEVAMVFTGKVLLKVKLMIEKAIM